jgi:hypothetical protein
MEIYYQETLRLIEENPEVALLVAIGMFILLLLIISFIGSLFSSSPKPRVVSVESIDQLAGKLKNISEESAGVLQHLEQLIQDKRSLIAEKEAYLADLNTHEKALQETLKGAGQTPPDFMVYYHNARKPVRKFRIFMWGVFTTLILGGIVLGGYYYIAVVQKGYKVVFPWELL